MNHHGPNGSIPNNFPSPNLPPHPPPHQLALNAQVYDARVGVSDSRWAALAEAKRKNREEYQKLHQIEVELSAETLLREQQRNPENMQQILR